MAFFGATAGGRSAMRKAGEARRASAPACSGAFQPVALVTGGVLVFIRSFIRARCPRVWRWVGSNGVLDLRLFERLLPVGVIWVSPTPGRGVAVPFRGWNRYCHGVFSVNPVERSVGCTAMFNN